jgi:UDP-N-acetylglucosamine 2-epimerase (non-hydrolysing)
MERVSPAVRNVRAARGVPMPTAHIAARAGLSGLGGGGGASGAGGRTHHHASPAVLALLVTAAIVLMMQVGGTLWRRDSAGDAPSAAYYDEVRTMATAFLRSGRGGSDGSTAVGHTHADGTVHGAAAVAAAAPPGLTQADVDRAVSDALAAQEAALLRKLTAAGAVAATGHGHGGVGGGGSGSCPDYAPTVRSKAGSGDVRLVVVVFGTRPEAIKLAPLVTELTAAAAQSDRTGSRVAVVTVATGQHESMLKSALEAFTIVPDVSLDLMSHGQTLGALGGRLLSSLSCVLDSLNKAPGMAVGGVVVQGDTITASQAASAAFLLGLPVAHVEAGLRTFMGDDPYPEEVARTTITAQASLHLAPTRYAADVLVQSGVCPEAVTVSGNTGIDALVGILRAGPSDDAKKALSELQLPLPDGPSLAAAITGDGAPPAGAGADGQKGPVTVVVTMHRRENIGARMAGMLEAVKTLAAQHAGGLRLLLPVHPNPAVKAAVEGALTGVPGVSLLPPLPYDSFVWVLAAASAVLTDSGGLQEEAVALGRHVFVMRQTSERPEALRTGLGRLVGTDPAGIGDALSEWLAALRNGAGGGTRPAWPPHRRPRAGARRTFGDGSASKRIAGVLVPWAQSAASAAGGLGAAPCRVGTLTSAAATGAAAIGSGAPGARAVTDHAVHAFGSHGGLGDSARHHGGTLLTGHARFGHTVECAAQPESPRPPQRQYGDAMAQPSFYDNGRDKDADAFGVTAIVAVWKRPQVLPRMLDGLLGQGHPVREVWVTTFASEHVDEFRKIVDEYQAKDPQGRKGRVKFVAGDPQFKYFGRFALALMAKTPHVLLLDDDSIPGARVLQNGLCVRGRSGLRAELLRRGGCCSQ